MAALAQSLPGSSGCYAWLWEGLKDEMAPYRGRMALVARMVTASTLVMILSMTFRVPYGAYGAIYALTLSRDSLEATANAARGMATGLALGGAYVVLGAMLVLDDPMLRFVWVVATLFLIFYLMSALSNHTAAARFGYLIVITIPLWDRQIPINQKVEGTLWAVGTITIASVITLLLEIVFAALGHSDNVTDAITERLESVEALFADYVAHGKVATATRSAITRLASVGISQLRRILQRSSYPVQYAQQMGAVVAHVGRLVDLAASFAQLSTYTSDQDRSRVRTLRQTIAGIRADLARRAIPLRTGLPGEGESPLVPLLAEIEKTVSLIPEVFAGPQSANIYGLPRKDRSRPVMARLRGALFNPEDIKFGLRGCLAASICYLAYNVLFWPEISTAVTTCLLTSLSTIGLSRQKQFLRFSGALVGGVGIGMGAQIFVLPYIDSIGAFTILFLAVAVPAAWVATSSARFSYFGVQMFVAFCLINLQEFKIQTSLAVARDRVLGILLGLFAMWLFFDQLWSTPAAVAMKKGLSSSLRLLAQLSKEPTSSNVRTAIERSYTLREAINTQLDSIRSLADGVLFEFGPTRHQDLAFRDRILRWQPQLRTIFVMRIAAWKYRLQLPGFELPEPERIFQQAFDSRSARILEEMADRLEHQTEVNDTAQSVKLAAPASSTGEQQRQSAPHIRTFLTLLREIDVLTKSLAEEISQPFDDREQVAPIQRIDRESRFEPA